MQIARRWLFFSLSLFMFVLTGIRGWAAPFHALSTGILASQAQDQPKQDSPKPATLTGTVAKDGDSFVLHDSSGAVYSLDDTDRVKPFEGKSVKVTGKLDMDAKVIHVETIEPLAA